MSGKTYPVEEFIKRLRAGEFASAPLEATGLIELPIEGDGLLFAHGSDCTNWISIPRKLIDRVEFLGVVSCKDHTHPFVTLIFSVPESPEGQAFAGIAKLSRAAASMPQTRAVPVLSGPIAVHPLQPHTFLTTFDMASPSSHAAFQAAGDVSGMPGRCPPGQKMVQVGDHWECVPIFG
jgi:hypothetical protein